MSQPKPSTSLTDSDTITDAAAFEFERRAPNRAQRLSFWALLIRIVRRKRFWLLLGLLSSGIIAAHGYRYGYLAPEQFLGFLRAHPIVAPAAFVVIYALMVVLLVPTLPFNLGAGIIWGTALGSLLTVVGFSIGAMLAFLIARHLHIRKVAQQFGGNAWSWLESASKEMGWKAVAFTRINPVFPSGPVNYFFGLTSISLKTYCITTAIFVIPPTILFSAIGASMGSLIINRETADLVRQITIGGLAFALLVLARLYVKKKLIWNSNDT